MCVTCYVSCVKDPNTHKKPNYSDLNITNKHNHLTFDMYVYFKVLAALAVKSTSSGIQRRVVRWKSTDLSEEYIASIFRVEYAKQNSSVKGGKLLTTAFTLVYCSAYSTLKMEAVCFSKTSVEFQWTKRRWIAEDSSLHNHHCENLKILFYYHIPVCSHIAKCLLTIDQTVTSSWFRD
jgi:hypothetical protein